MDFPRFQDLLHSSIQLFLGDLTDPYFGLAEDEYRRLVRTTDSVIHCAASLNRKSEKSCLNVNLRGTLEVIQLAMRARDEHGLRRFSHVSTVAVCGHRANEVVQEDASIDWNRSDYDPYARTKKFCEHMVRQLATGCAAHDFSPQHRSRRQPPPGNKSIRHGSRLRFPRGASRASLPLDGSHRHRSGGLRCRRDRNAAPERKARARDLSSFVRRRFGNVRRTDGRARESAGKARPGVCAQP